ncbi:hypothetical protein ACRJ4W_47455 [Streptomyces sp. GLT-R25]
MNVDELVRDTLRETAVDSVSVPAGFADRVLAVRRRRRSRRIAGTAAVTAAVIAVAVAVPLLDGGGDDVRPASEMNKSDIIGHPDEQSPPRDLIAAGDTVLAAFSVSSNVKQDNGDVIRTPTYGLLNQKTGKYEKTRKWAFLDVAPGSRTAAVLEQELPAKRIGLLDLITGKVDRWIPVDHGVGGVAFSPDGKRLVATTYAKNPDRYLADRPISVNGKKEPGPVPSRTGFTIVDVASGESDWHEVPLLKDEFGLPEHEHARGLRLEPRRVAGLLLHDVGRLRRVLRPGRRQGPRAGREAHHLRRGGHFARREAGRRGLRRQRHGHRRRGQRREDREACRQAAGPAAPRLGRQQAAHRLGLRPQEVQRQGGVPQPVAAGDRRHQQGRTAERLP